MITNKQSKNFMIGTFVLVAFAIIIYILLFLHPTVGDEGQILKVRFTNIDKISIGTRVLFAGHPVGEVDDIQEVDDARSLVNLHDGKVYIYELTLKIDSGVIVYTSDQIAASTSGLLGERAVSITPHAAKPGQALVRVTDQVLFAVPPTSVENAVKVIGQLASKLDKGLATMADGHFWEHITDAAENIAELTDALDPEAVKNGTVGKLFNSDDLYLRMTSIMNKGETLMDDINHYGLLFHSNKTWQRLRARRMNLLATLSSPQEFTNFFNDEVNQITTAISRVGLVISSDDDPCCWSNVCSQSFEKVFSDLLRRIDTLGDNIKMLNEQIVDQREHCCPPQCSYR